MRLLLDWSQEKLRVNRARLTALCLPTADHGSSSSSSSSSLLFNSTFDMSSDQQSAWRADGRIVSGNKRRHLFIETKSGWLVGCPGVIGLDSRQAERMEEREKKREKIIAASCKDEREKLISLWRSNQKKELEDWLHARRKKQGDRSCSRATLFLRG